MERSKLATALALLAIALLVHGASACETVYDYSNSRAGETGALQNANLTRQFRRVQYAFYTASSEDDLSARFEAKDATWCNVMDFVLKPGKCTLSLSPFGTTFIGIAGKPLQQACASARALLRLNQS